MLNKTVISLATLLMLLLFNQTVIASFRKTTVESAVQNCSAENSDMLAMKICVGKQLSTQMSVPACKEMSGDNQYYCIGDQVTKESWFNDLVTSSGAYPVFCCKSGACPTDHLGSCGYCMLYCSLHHSHDCKKKVDKNACIGY